MTVRSASLMIPPAMLPMPAGAHATSLPARRGVVTRLSGAADV